MEHQTLKAKPQEAQNILASWLAWLKDRMYEPVQEEGTLES